MYQLFAGFPLWEPRAGASVFFIAKYPAKHAGDMFCRIFVLYFSDLTFPVCPHRDIKVPMENYK